VCLARDSNDDKRSRECVRVWVRLCVCVGGGGGTKHTKAMDDRADPRTDRKGAPRSWRSACHSEGTTGGSQRRPIAPPRSLHDQHHNQGRCLKECAWHRCCTPRPQEPRPLPHRSSCPTLSTHTRTQHTRPTSSSRGDDNQKVKQGRRGGVGDEPR
jgi:hypothetical protein